MIIDKLIKIHPIHRTPLILAISISLQLEYHNVSLPGPFIDFIKVNLKKTLIQIANDKIAKHKVEDNPKNNTIESIQKNLSRLYAILIDAHYDNWIFRF